MTERTNDYLGLPIFRRLFGFGDVLTLRVQMTNAFLGNVDRDAVRGALPPHPRVKLHPLSPLVVVQSDFLHATDNGDPDKNDYPYKEVMLCVLLEGAAGTFGPMFPLILFVDDPLAVCAGREFHGFPKVPAEITYNPTSATIGFASYPNRVRTVREVMRTEWEDRAGFAAKAFSALGSLLGGAVRAAGLDQDTVDLFEQLLLYPAGEIWNIRQVPDLVRPRRAVYSELTRFKPQLTEPSNATLLSRFRVTFPDEPTWSIGRRFFRGEVPRVLAAMRWEATMHVMGGETIDRWMP